MADKVKRKNKADYGDDFVPPDGGWGWVVCLASGFTNVFMFPVFQFFGIIFRDKFAAEGITNQETTIMINAQLGFAALSGLFYGPIFRNFSFRKVAIFGSIQVITGILFLAFAKPYYLLFIIYVFYLAAGKELVITAKQMAFNTYFKDKRRKALSIVGGIPSVCNIGLPHFVTWLMSVLQSFGTLLVLDAISILVLLCSLTYKPVKKHVKKEQESTLDEVELNPNGNEKSKIQDSEALSSAETEKPEATKLLENESEATKITTDTSVKNTNANQPTPYNNTTEPKPTEHSDTKPERKTVGQKIIDFFDADLMKDISFLNICFGLSCSMLVEQNYRILAPFFLKEFGYTNTQIATIMTFGFFPDLFTKITIPHVLDFFKVKLTNRTLWILSILGMLVGEIVIAQNPHYFIILFFMFFEGIFTGAKSIFTGMLIPDHVILKKMPAAFGLSRFINGVFLITMGLLIGYIRSRSNYTTILVFLNFIMLLPIILWIVEICWRNYIQKSRTTSEQTSN